MKQKIEVIYQDSDIVVVNKPAGILVIPDKYMDEDKTLVGMLKKQLNQKILVVHTIGTDVTGVLIFAKNSKCHKNISIQFENSKIYKKYIAIVSGVLEDDQGTIDKPIFISEKGVFIDDVAGKKAITNFKVLERFKSYTLVEAVPLTCRKHQVRIHFWSLGHPLAIDDEYGIPDPIMLSSFKRGYKAKKNEVEKPLISRLTLHAAALTLTLPSTQNEKTFEAPVPKDFEITLKHLRKYMR